MLHFPGVWQTIDTGRHRIPKLMLVNRNATGSLHCLLERIYSQNLVRSVDNDWMDTPTTTAILFLICVQCGGRGACSFRSPLLVSFRDGKY